SAAIQVESVYLSVPWAVGADCVEVSTLGTVRSCRGVTWQPCANYGNLCRVFEWHGWATIVASPGAGDDAAAEAHQRATDARVARVIAGAAGVGERLVDDTPHICASLADVEPRRASAGA